MTDTDRLQAYDEPHGPPRRRPTAWVGMVVFAGVLLLMVGGFQLIEGFVALFRQDFFLTTRNGLVIPVDYTAWGWTHILVGAIGVLTGIGILAGMTWARVVGIVLAVLSAFANLTFLPAYPLWAITIIAMDVLVIYALAVHGRETAS
jgi:hypothetical protein